MSHYVQPYELFGLSTSASAGEIRRRYYELALYCHPDKGGSAKDMVLLHTAFQWLMERAVGTSMDADDAQASFDDFVKSRQKTEVLPSMTEVAMEARGVALADIRAWVKNHAPMLTPEQVRWFELTVSREIYLASLVPDIPAVLNVNDICSYVLRDVVQCWGEMVPASVPHGYGDAMAIDDDAPLADFGKQQLIVYKEQIPFGAVAQPCPVVIPQKLDDYTTRDGGAADYHAAFMEPNDDMLAECQEQEGALDLDTRLEKRMQERSEEDAGLAKEMDRMHIDAKERFMLFRNA